jgi:hypothetical protein
MTVAPDPGARFCGWAGGPVLLDPGREPKGPCAVHRVERVVDETGPHLVELAGVSLDPGDAGTVVTHDRNTVTELGPEHGQGAVDAIGHIDLLHRGPVHLRVRLYGGDEFGDALGRLDVRRRRH